MRVRLGSFDLIEPIAQGGMGDVWSAVHRGSSLDVAVKVISADYARHPGFVASLRHEVRSMARLSHPNIVRVLDQGTVDARAAATSDYQLVDGSPFIAMESVRGGTLADHILRLQWDDVRIILLKLLSALAHAHAHDVLHRDLKPANILLQSSGTIWDLRLTDFGIAQPLHAERLVGPRVAGTPQFMAPEQARGDWRAYRPATDLFAVGRIANALLARDDEGVAYVPEGFDEWMGCLLADLPQQRFTMAADAASALRGLGPATQVLVDDLLLDATNQPTQVDLPASGDVPSSARGATLGRFRPAIPLNWRRTEERSSQPPLLNAGAGLLGLRLPALVGRDHEQTMLWNLLRRVHDTSAAHLVVLRGPEGVGKRALARWLQARSYEEGASWPHHVAFDPIDTELTALQSILAREFKTQGLSHEDARPRILRLARMYGVTDDYDLEALIEAANPKTEGTPGFRFGNPSERTRLLARFLHWAARARPVLLTLEDVQWSAAALKLVETAFELDRETPVPLLIVVTVEERALATAVMERTLLDTIVQTAGRRCLELPLAPLTPDAQRALIASLIGLDPTLVATLAGQTGGNPLHAIQRVTDLHETGRLIPTPHGLTLRDAEDQTLPMDRIWQHRLVTFLDERSANSRISVELLAVLGRSVLHRDWVRLTRRVGVAPTQHLVDGLVTAGLLRMEGDVYTLTHASLRDAILQLARQDGRLRSHHASCADMLRSNAHGDRHWGAVGEHLVLAGHTEAALDPLRQGAETAFREGLVHRAGELVERWLAALATLDLPADDPRRGDSLLLQGRLAITGSEPKYATRAAESLRVLAEHHGWKRHQVQALHLQGRAAYLAGHHDDAILLLDQALDTDEAELDDSLRAMIHFDLARTWIHWGDVDKTTHHTAIARPLFLAANDRQGERLCILLAASAAFLSGRPDAALSLAGTAKSLASELGSLQGQAEALTMAGEVHRSQGRMDKALAAYRLAHRMVRSSGGPNKSVIIDLNLASALAALDEHEEALATLDPTIARLHQLGRGGLEAVAHCLSLPSLAATRKPGRYERHLDAATELLHTTRFREADAVAALERAATEARRAGWTALSARTAALAIKMDGWN